jgi:hypothetical protein
LRYSENNHDLGAYNFGFAWVLYRERDFLTLQGESIIRKSSVTAAFILDGFWTAFITNVTTHKMLI